MVKIIFTHKRVPVLGVNYTLGCAEVIDQWDSVCFTVERSKSFWYIKLYLWSALELLAYYSDISQSCLDDTKQFRETKFYFFKSCVFCLKKKSTYLILNKQIYMEMEDDTGRI